jgi:hypothetical protein
MLYFRTAPPERVIYIRQCWHRLLQKLGAVVSWDLSYRDIPGGMPHIEFWKRGSAKCFVHLQQRASFSFLFRCIRYNSSRGRHKTVKLNSGRWY